MTNHSDLTTCVHCGQKFSHPRIAIIGERGARLENYLKGLAEHLHGKHPELLEVMVQQGAAFMEMLFLRNFRTTDAELAEQQDRVRWQVHQQTLKVRYPDENLKEQATELARRLSDTAIAGLDDCGTLDRELLALALCTEAFISIRDALEETGKYSLTSQKLP